MKITLPLVVLASTLVLGCSRTQTTKLTAADGAPAAMGSLKSSLGDNGNTELTVEVEHLALPARVASGASMYVVWAKPDSQDPPQNLGVMNVDESRKGKLETKTPLKSFDVLITAEPTANVTQPSGAQVMKGRVGGNGG